MKKRNLFKKRKAVGFFRGRQPKKGHDTKNVKPIQFISPIVEPTEDSVVYIYRSEFDILSRYILDCPNIETGGELMGFFTEHGDFVVCLAIGPGTNANHQTTFFQQDVTYLKKCYSALNKKYGLRYIGEWHSHHKLGLAKPSGHDATTVVNGMRILAVDRFLLCIGNVDKKDRSTLNAYSFHQKEDYNYRQVKWKIIDTESPYRSLMETNNSNLLIMPHTEKPCHGDNLMAEEHPSLNATTPKYKKDYWLDNKDNNLVLKKMIDFLSGDENERSVKPMLDERGLVHLFVQGAEKNEEIVFGENFPNEAPLILFSDGRQFEDSTEWEIGETVLNNFIHYYKALSYNHRQDILKDRSCKIVVFNTSTKEFQFQSADSSETEKGLSVTEICREPFPF